MSDPVARLNAALEGRYAIERELGVVGKTRRKLSSFRQQWQKGGKNV